MQQKEAEKLNKAIIQAGLSLPARGAGMLDASKLRAMSAFARKVSGAATARARIK